MFHNNIIKFEPLLDNLNTSCRIIIKDKLMGSGFFCKININHNINNKEIVMLFTNNHVLKTEDLKLGSEFEIEYINKEKYNKTQLIKKEKTIIKINEKRLVFANASYDYCCVEIYEDDILKIVNYLEIDDNININNPFQEYINQNCLIIQYPNGIFGFAKGPIIDINKRNKIFYKISTEYGSSGSPIILSKNFKIIGIHCGRTKNIGIKKGIFFKPILEEIQIKYEKIFRVIQQIEYKGRLIDIYHKGQFILNKFKWYLIYSN